MDIRAVLMGVAFAAMWSSAFTSARIAVAYAPPFLLLSVRFAISGLLAVFIARMLGQGLPGTRRQWLAIALFGIFQNTAYLGLNFMAMQTVEASVAVIIASTLPLLVAAASWILFGEKLRPAAIVGLAAGLAGALIIMSGRLSAGTDPKGVMLCVIGVLALTAATLLVRGAGSKNLLMIVGLQMLIGSATLLPVSMLLETWQITWSQPLILAFIYTTLVPGLAATLVWFMLVARIGATRSATFHFLNPFLGVAIAALILNETLGLRDLIGVAIIMAGILAVQLSKQPAHRT